MAMGKHRKRTPFAVEMQPPHQKGWYVMAVYRSEDEAEMQAELMRKRSPEAKVRVRDLRVGQ